MMFPGHEWGMGYDSLFALSIPMTVPFGAAALCLLRALPHPAAIAHAR